MSRDPMRSYDLSKHLEFYVYKFYSGVNMG